MVITGWGRAVELRECVRGGTKQSKMPHRKGGAQEFGRRSSFSAKLQARDCELRGERPW